jgi:hypothetical protein
MIRLIKNVVLGKVRGEGLETLAIARFKYLKGYVKERNRFMSKLC